MSDDIRTKIKKAGKILPYGAKKEIAKITGISNQTVVTAFKHACGHSDQLLKDILEASQPFLLVIKLF